MQLYYITNRHAFPGDETSRRRQLLDKISEAAHAGVDYIQLREKDLPIKELESLTWDSMRILREANATTKLLINSRTDVALAAGADGVHLRSDDASPLEVAAIQSRAKQERAPLITAVSCHSVEDFRRAGSEGANFAVLAPIFDKQTTTLTQGIGLEPLKPASQGKFPVFALGGLTLENAQACRKAGATGIAAIRLFQENNIQQIADKLSL